MTKEFRLVKFLFCIRNSSRFGNRLRLYNNCQLFMDFQKFTKLAQLVNPRKVIFYQIYKYILVELLYGHLSSIPHFKGLSMRNLQYRIEICHNKVTKTVYLYYEFLWTRLQQLFLVLWDRPERTKHSGQANQALILLLIDFFAIYLHRFAVKGVFSSLWVNL